MSTFTIFLHTEGKENKRKLLQIETNKYFLLILENAFVIIQAQFSY